MFTFVLQFFKRQFSRLSRLANWLDIVHCIEFLSHHECYEFSHDNTTDRHSHRNYRTQGSFISSPEPSPNPRTSCPMNKWASKSTHKCPKDSHIDCSLWNAFPTNLVRHCELMHNTCGSISATNLVRHCEFIHNTCGCTLSLVVNNDSMYPLSHIPSSSTQTCSLPLFSNLDKRIINTSAKEITKAHRAKPYTYTFTHAYTTMSSQPKPPPKAITKPHTSRFAEHFEVDMPNSTIGMRVGSIATVPTPSRQKAVSDARASSSVGVERKNTSTLR